MPERWEEGGAGQQQKPDQIIHQTLKLLWTEKNKKQLSLKYLTWLHCRV